MFKCSVDDFSVAFEGQNVRNSQKRCSWAFLKDTNVKGLVGVIFQALLRPQCARVRLLILESPLAYM